VSTEAEVAGGNISVVCDGAGLGLFAAVAATVIGRNKPITRKMTADFRLTLRFYSGMLQLLFSKCWYKHS